MARWNAPEAMNRMKSVFTGPYLVVTVVPSISGSRSRCTPSRETSPPRKPPSLRAHTLSISSRNTMPFCSACATASLVTCSVSSSCSDSSLVSAARASATLMRRDFWGRPIIPFIISPRLIIWPGGMPGMSRLPTGELPVSATCTSTSLSSSSPARSMRRNLARVSPPAPSPTSAVTSLSSACNSALACTPLREDSFSMVMLTSTRSRTMLSTSRPT